MEGPGDKELEVTSGEFSQKPLPLGLYVLNKNTCVCAIALINSGSLIQKK